MKTKSLGQELYEIEADVVGGGRPWAEVSDIGKAAYEEVALRFLERAEKLEGDLEDAEMFEADLAFRAGGR